MSYSTVKVQSVDLRQQSSGGDRQNLECEFVLLVSSFCPIGFHQPDAKFRKEVIQPQLPLQLPCYDFVPVTSSTLGSSLLTVSFPTSGVTSSHDVTGGVYKARERIHRTVLTRGY